MNIGKYSTILVSLLLAGILIGTVGIPVIDSIANQTNTVSNSGAQWVRMAYVEDDSDYSFTVHMNDNDTVTITNGDSVQTGPADDIILYADEYHTLFIKDGILCTVGDSFNDHISGGPTVDGYDVTITRTDGTVTKTDRFGSNWGEPSWAYVPITGGIYSSFGANAVPLHRYSEEVVAVGTYAGVYAGQMGVVDILYDYGLVMDADVTADYINSIQWVQESELAEDEPLNVLPFDPNDIDPLDPGVIVDPFDPGQIQPIDIDPLPIDPGNQLMGVPTPTYTDGDWGYDLEGSNACIVSYSGAGGGTITIPNTVGGYNVNKVGKGSTSAPVFQNTVTCTALIISEGIQYIMDGAFYGCSGIGGSVTLPSTLENIQRASFYGTGIASVNIPKSAGIYSEAFSNCTNLTTVTFDPNRTIELYIAGGVSYNGVFQGCTSLTSIEFPKLRWNANLTNAFYGCTSLTTVTFDPTQSNGDYHWDNTFRDCTNLQTVSIPAGYSTLKGTFNGCTSLTSFSIAVTCSSIGADAFKNCQSLQGVTIPDGVTTIDVRAYSGCSGITSLNLGNGVKTIKGGNTAGEGAFYGLSSLSGTLVIPASVTTIENRAFYGAGSNGNLNGIVILSDVTPQSNSFENSVIPEVLNLSNTEWTTTSYGLDADSVQDHIEADNYLAITSYSETVQKTGSVYDMINLIPLVITMGVVLFAVYCFIRK